MDGANPSVEQMVRGLGVEPWVYLRDVLTRLPATPAEQLGDLLPDHWRAAHQAKVATPATGSTWAAG